MDALIENCERVIPVVTFLDLRKLHHKEFYRDVPSLSVKARAIYERATDLSSTIFSVGFENLSGAREARKEFNGNRLANHTYCLKFQGNKLSVTIPHIDHILREFSSFNRSYILGGRSFSDSCGRS